MLRKIWFLGLLVIAITALIAWSFADPQKTDKGKKGADREPVVIAQISDTHLGLKRAPDAAENLRKVVNMVNDRKPDAVIITGDLGERPEAWEEARDILRGLKAKMFVIPGNHDVNQKNLDSWRSFWGKDYDEFHVKYVTIFGLDSQLMGNYDDFHSRDPQPLSSQNASESKRMFDWLAKEIEDEKHERDSSVIFAMQHVPNSRANGGSFPNDPKPYWTTEEPYRSQALELLKRMGVKHMFVGHWHKGMVYEADGITYHVAPATSWSDWDDHLGFAMHTISPDGKVKTEFVNLPGADTHPTH
jgi:3',5'-cyclic AMP phosphodiesterase CpdA